MQLLGKQKVGVLGCGRANRKGKTDPKGRKSKILGSGRASRKGKVRAKGEKK